VNNQSNIQKGFMRKINTLIFVFFITYNFFGQKKPAYKLYNSKGHKVSYQRMIKKLRKANVVLFGEHHNNPISHWLELEVTKDIYKTKNLVLGAEMFEADNQTPLNNYLSGKINNRGLDTLARLWNNYKTDYKPLVDFAKKNKLEFIATNVPRKYASLVYKKGFLALNSLPKNEKSWIAPLPIKYDATLPGYVKMKAMMGGHGGDNLPKAQAIKDATMAYFLLKNLKNNSVFIHYNGSYHSDNFEGIYWYLKKEKPQLNVKTISIVEQQNVKKFAKENKNLADFIIVVDKFMTKTY
jgi:uncharacterized iron-regulated protein